MVDDLLDEGTAEHALGMDEFKDRFEKKAKEKDDFPSGDSASSDGDTSRCASSRRRSGHGGQRRRGATRAHPADGGRALEPLGLPSADDDWLWR